MTFAASYFHLLDQRFSDQGLTGSIVLQWNAVLARRPFV